MASPTSLTASPGSVRNWNDDNSRVKILCSFNGGILPRPRDGKLRYVGGETRILSVPMDIGFVELMARMKELFEDARMLKYKQPDEDLDALVSVVNDDDVINMMEEYAKLGSGTSDQGFTRLRVFLFSNSEIDAPLQFLDALNTFNDSPEFVRQSISEFQVMNDPADDVLLTEQYFNRLNLEGGIHNPGNIDSPMTSVNLHHLTIPHLDPSRNPAYYTPRHPANDVPSSPSCSCYYAPYGEPVDAIYDKVCSEDYFGHNVDHQHLLAENVSWLEPSSISGEQIGYPNNRLNGTNMFEGNSVCEECSPPFPHSFYIRDPNDPRTFYNEAQPQITIEPAAYLDSNHIPLPYVHDRSYNIRRMHEFGSELYHEQPLARYKNYGFVYGLENLHYASVNYFSRDVQSPIQGSPSSETSISPQQQIVPGNFFKHPSVDRTPKLEDTTEVDVPDCYHVRPLKLMPNSYLLEDHNLPSESSQSTTDMINCSNPNDSMAGLIQSPNLSDCKALPLNTKNKEIIQNADSPESLVKVGTKYVSERNLLHGGTNFVPHSLEKEDLIVERLNYMPQVIESVKNAALEYGEEVKHEVPEGVDAATQNLTDVEEETTHELNVEDAPEDLELDSDTGTESNSKIEPTKAEEEAIAKGLQTIKNDDLEEVQQLGSGSYGSVYHGKWKGSDVAIKRIKASCFTGSPAERQRMIADFWKEALMLSSLHHPNVVAFYGIVRDGLDGSLATVTEYMVNGSLKQFLKKKDRTIDRRKRLIIAMDTAFGMEYLHGRNIVHFDLKCENLLVNMRDPHRPICKIGDLGLSKAKQQTMVSGGVRGTLPWMAPELLSGISHMVTDKIDVYSFGVVMWELLTGEEPYTNMHCASIIGGIVNNTLRPTIPTWCDPEWKSLMESCWSGDPHQRPSFSEISHKLRTMAATIKVR